MSRLSNPNDLGSGFPSKKDFETNGSIDDADLTIVGDADPTKKLVFDVSAQTTGKTVTIAAGANTGNVTHTLPSVTSTLAAKSTSEICVSNITGNGSTNAAVLILSTIVRNNGGTDTTYASTAAAGNSFTVNTPGVYSLSMSAAGIPGAEMGISRNATGSQLTNEVIDAMPAGVLIAFTQIPCTNVMGNCSVTLPLVAGDVIRFQGDSGIGGDGNYELCNVCKIS